MPEQMKPSPTKPGLQEQLKLAEVRLVLVHSAFTSQGPVVQGLGSVRKSIIIHYIMFYMHACMQVTINTNKQTILSRSIHVYVDYMYMFRKITISTN